METVKKALKRLLLFYFLMALSIFPNSHILPTGYPQISICCFYLLLLFTLPVIYYRRIVISRRGLRVMMIGSAVMLLFFILLRAVKYTAFPALGFPARFVWYLYYVPMIVIPVTLYYLAMLIFEKEDRIIPRGCLWAAVVAALLVALVLTNDFHQQVFRFNPGFENWDSDYSYGWGIYPLSVWQYGFSVTAIIILLVKCRISRLRVHAWVLLIPMVIGTAMIIALAFGKMPQVNGHNPLELPEIYCFMVAGVLECCICIGLIPTNEDHSKIFRISSIAAQITDKNGIPVYTSDNAPEMSPELFARENGARIDTHTIQRKIEIPGGCALWLEDVTELDRINEELAETEARLSEETELIRLQNELREKQLQLARRSALYDSIAENTLRQSRAISLIARHSRESSDPAEKECGRRKITLLAAYIKRYANMMLLSEDSDSLKTGELSLSLAELLQSLNSCGIPGELISDVSGTISAESALTVFAAVERLIENSYDTLHGLTVNLSDSTGFTCKLILEGTEANPDEEMSEKLYASGFETDTEFEDGTSYISFSAKKEAGK